MENNFSKNLNRVLNERGLTHSQLAKMAGISPETIKRIIAGKPCQMFIKLQIKNALGMSYEELNN